MHFISQKLKSTQFSQKLYKRRKLNPLILTERKEPKTRYFPPQCVILPPRWLSSARFKYKPGYRPCDLLSIECSHWLKLQHSDWRADLVKDFFEKMNFPPKRALKFFTGHMIYNLDYTYILQTTTTLGFQESN